MEHRLLLSLTLSVILFVSRSAADGPPGLQSWNLVLVEEALEGGRQPGWDGLAGWWQAAEAFDVHSDRGEHVL
jgi:hypothetical protein